jgi:hypothetical protein
MMHELVWYAAIALALTLSVGLFFSAKTEIARLRRRMDNDRGAWEEALGQQNRQVEALRAEMRKMEVPHTSFVPPPTAPAGLNVSKRNQALRLHRAGHTAEQIAESLGMPEGEVALLLKVQTIVLEHF